MFLLQSHILNHHRKSTTNNFYHRYKYGINVYETLFLRCLRWTYWLLPDSYCTWWWVLRCSKIRIELVKWFLRKLFSHVLYYPLYFYLAIIYPNYILKIQINRESRRVYLNEKSTNFYICHTVLRGSGFLADD